MKSDFQFYSSRGNLLKASFYQPAQKESSACILFFHGFKGFKDWGFVPYAANWFSQRGFQFIAVNYSHNGIGENPTEFSETEKFRDNTFSLELEETNELIEIIAKNKIPGISFSPQIGLLGHSRGGGIALLAGLPHPRVTAVCTWAAVSFFNRYPPDVIEKWKSQGYLDVVNQRTGQVLQIGWNLHADLMENIHGKFNIQKYVESASKPLCIIHGQNDEAIPWSDAENLFRWSGQKAEIHLIENAGHTFGAVHPFTGTNPALEMVLGHSLQFFRKYLT